jgi:hypothetical protein
MFFLQVLGKISRSSVDEKTIMVITAVLILALVVDMELSNVADILRNSIVSEKGIITFIAISIIYLSCQYLLVRYAKVKTADFRSRRKEIRFIDIVVISVEAIVISVFVLVILEILLQRSYGMVALLITIVISNGLAVWIMLTLSKRLYEYYKSHHDYAILSYLLSGMIIAITALVTIFFMVPIIISKPDIITAALPVIFPSFIPGSTLDILNYAYYILAIVSFLSVWTATAILLSVYAKKLGKIRYWIVISLPLLFYTAQILVVELKLSLPLGNLDAISFIFYYRVIFTVSSTLGGILFAMPFILISRMVPKTNTMHHQLIIFGLGIALFFVSGSATVYHNQFPPFGLATVALTGISSYLMFLGLYSSAISLSEDSELRKLIRKSVQNWKFFLKLGDSEVEKRIIDQVEGVKQSMITDTGVAPSISIDEARDYLNEVLNEIKKDGAK